MRLIITEKRDAAQKIAKLLGTNVKSDKVYSTPIYRFNFNGDECVTIGLRGHILNPDFTPRLQCLKTTGWRGITVDSKKIPVKLPKNLAKPPYKYKRKPYLKDGIDLQSWKMEALPYLVYAPIEKLPKEKSIIRSVKNLAKKAESVVIATDFDREGELIGSDALNCVLDVNPKIDVSRARYSAFTQDEIDEAFNNLCQLDENLAEAGASRQDIDLIWGAALTRFLTLVKFAGYGNVRSSGRVQTPTLALVVDKERERNAFKSEKFWVVDASFGDASSEFSVKEIESFKFSGNKKPKYKQQPLPDGAFIALHKTSKFKSKEDAELVMADVKDAKFAHVVSAQKKSRKIAPPVPFNTTSLMAAAAQEGISPARTMRIAEGLYMAGYISYPRVDNTVYPKSLDLTDCVKKLSKSPAYRPYCQKLLSQSSLSATRGKKETTDHPPIYPVTAASPDDLAPADYKLYNLIARRFLATLSQHAVMLNTTVILDVNSQQFVAKGNILQEKGFREIYPYGLKRDSQLPQLSEGEKITFNGARCTEKQTEPPARYSQGRLITEMEKLGLGTKATRHSIIERLYNVKYIQNDPIEPSQLGVAVIEALEKFAPHITQPDMTSQLEAEMDEIAEGKTTRSDVVLDSRKKLAAELDNLIPHTEEIAESLSDAVAADAYVGKCPKCGHDLQIRASNKTKSMFIGCSNWPDCDMTYPLPSGKIEATKDVCSQCGMPTIKLTVFRQKPRILCIDPNCPTNVEPDVCVGICPECAKQGKEALLLAKKNPKTLKRFIRCENYEDCKTGYPLPQFGKISAPNTVCEDCGAPMVTITSDRGPWTLCPNFSCPAKNKEKKKSKTAKAKKK